MPDNVSDIIKQYMVSNDIAVYAKGSVNAYNRPGGTVVNTYGDGSYIGDIYSFVDNADGLWWIFSPSNYDPNNPTYYFVKNNPSSLSVPILPELIQKVADAKDAADKASKGILQYNIDKYGKWIVGGIVVAVALPTIVNTLQRKKQSAVSGTNDKKALLLLLLLGGGVYLYAQSAKKKRSGSIEIGPLDQGEFGPAAPPDINATIFYDATKFMAGNSRPSVPLTI